MANGTIVAAAMFFSSMIASAPCSGQEPESAPLDFAITLAQNEVPVGIVALRTLVAHTTGLPNREVTAADKAAFRDVLASRLDRFNASNGGFRATRDNGVVHLRTAEGPSDVSAALERSRYTKGAAEIPAMTAVLKFVVGAMRGVDPPEGLAFAGILPGPECPLYSPIQIREGSSSAVELLDETVQQVPGLVWIVSYTSDSPDEDLKVGLMCTSGNTQQIDVYP